ncbi:hypothetical protein [Actinocorallia lasiicapitis]
MSALPGWNVRETKWEKVAYVATRMDRIGLDWHEVFHGLVMTVIADTPEELEVALEAQALLEVKIEVVPHECGYRASSE